VVEKARGCSALLKNKEFIKKPKVQKSEGGREWNKRIKVAPTGYKGGERRIGARLRFPGTSSE